MNEARELSGEGDGSEKKTNVCSGERDREKGGRGRERDREGKRDRGTGRREREDEEKVSERDRQTDRTKEEGGRERDHFSGYEQEAGVLSVEKRLASTDHLLLVHHMPLSLPQHLFWPKDCLTAAKSTLRSALGILLPQHCLRHSSGSRCKLHHVIKARTCSD